MLLPKVNEQKRIYKIYQSNNKVDVIANLSLKLPERKYGNYYNKKSITEQKVR